MSMEWNQEGMTRIRLRRKLTAAIQVIDDFTGRPVDSSDVQVRVAQSLKRPIRKADGYFLFLDLEAQTLDITVEAWAYHAAQLRVETGSLSALYPVVKLRLTPNRNYRIPQKTTCLEGNISPGTQVRVFCENDPKPLRILYDYQCRGPMDGRLLQIYDPLGGDLGGRQFALLGRGEQEPEFITVQETLDSMEGGCILAEPMGRDHKKAGTTVLPLFAASADERGHFFLPLKQIPVKEYVCRVCWRQPGEPWQETKMTLESGRVSKFVPEG